MARKLVSDRAGTLPDLLKLAKLANGLINALRAYLNAKLCNVGHRSPGG